MRILSFCFAILLAVILGMVSPSVQASGEDAPTFARDVAPILFENCASCHRPGEAGPFSLLSYGDARKRSRLIARVTGDRYMPPWKSEPSDFVSFHNERRLSNDQIEVLKRWHEAGAPAGDPADLPERPEFTPGWQLGEPDLIVEMTESYDVPAEGADIYRNFVVPIPIEEGKWLKAMEFRPENPSVVHHSILFADAKGTGRERDAGEPDEPGFRGFEGLRDGKQIGVWAVGNQPVPLPEGLAHRIEPGTDLVLNIHFHPSGKKEAERSRVGLYFTEEPPTKRMVMIRMHGEEIDIPPGESDYKVSAEFTVPVDVEAVMIFPHAHYLGREMQGTATFPDGRREHLIHIKNWDFNWQESYVYKEPVPLPAGTVLRMDYTYDNSADNPRNPNHPPVRVTRGFQSTDEMGLLWINVVPKDKDDVPE